MHVLPDAVELSLLTVTLMLITNTKLYCVCTPTAFTLTRFNPKHCKRCGVRREPTLLGILCYYYHTYRLSPLVYCYNLSIYVLLCIYVSHCTDLLYTNFSILLLLGGSPLFKHFIQLRFGHYDHLGSSFARDGRFSPKSFSLLIQRFLTTTLLYRWKQRR
jgi:hypothetical protein